MVLTWAGDVTRNKIDSQTTCQDHYHSLHSIGSLIFPWRITSRVAWWIERRPLAAAGDDDAEVEEDGEEAKNGILHVYHLN